MESSRKNILLFGIVMLIGIGAVKVFILDEPAPAPGAAVTQICNPQIQPVQTITCVVNGKIGTKTQSCTYIATKGRNEWVDITACSVSNGPAVVPVAPVIPSYGAGPALVCRDSSGKTSYSVQVEDSLDDEAAPITRLSNVTVYLDTTENTATSSSSGGTTMYTGCTEKYVSFFGIDDDNSGDDIYPVDSVIVLDPNSGIAQTFGPNAVPTFYTQNNVKYGHVLASTTMKAEKQGNMTLTLWDSNGATSDAILDVSTQLGGTNSFGRLYIQQGADDKAAHGVSVIFDIDYNATGLKNVGLDCGPGYTVTRDDSIVPSYNSSFDRGYRIFRNGVPLKLDQSDRTPQVSSGVTCTLDVMPKSTCSGNFSIMAKVIDTMKDLDASTAKLKWRGGGALYSESANYANLGIQVAQEPAQTLEIHCSG